MVARPHLQPGSCGGSDPNVSQPAARPPVLLDGDGRVVASRYRIRSGNPRGHRRILSLQAVAADVRRPAAGTTRGRHRVFACHRRHIGDGNRGTRQHAERMAARRAADARTLVDRARAETRRDRPYSDAHAVGRRRHRWPGIRRQTYDRHVCRRSVRSAARPWPVHVASLSRTLRRRVMVRAGRDRWHGDSIGTVGIRAVDPFR